MAEVTAATGKQTRSTEQERLVPAAQAFKASKDTADKETDTADEEVDTDECFCRRQRAAALFIEKQKALAAAAAAKGHEDDTDECFYRRQRAAALFIERQKEIANATAHGCLGLKFRSLDDDAGPSNADEGSSGHFGLKFRSLDDDGPSNADEGSSGHFGLKFRSLDIDAGPSNADEGSSGHFEDAGNVASQEESCSVEGRAGKAEAAFTLSEDKRDDNEAEEGGSEAMASIREE
ncbi:hypothetical protein COCOBI_03-0220 [Coccomyxa sp. Obi]|nr:hypothetical protein COCOBI_03-0220 [Coccomyxa sp. Obi]